MSLLEIQNLSIAFGQIPVVSHLNFQLEKGQCLGLVGESGSGKSITALSILQLLPPTSVVDTQSKILFHNRDLLALSEQEIRSIRGGKIAMIFQDAMSAFNPVLTIGHQIKECCSLHQHVFGLSVKKRIFQLFEDVGITECERVFNAYPHEISGGMRQRAMIALALSGNPEILIADEPTTALDVTLQAQILGLLKELKAKKDLTLLFINHDLAIVQQLADQVLVLRNGHKVEEAPAKIFFTHPQHEYSKLLLDAVLPLQPKNSTSLLPNALLDVRNLSVYFPIRSTLLKRKIAEIKAVDDVSFKIPQGQTLALVGESGSGKTTIAKAILRLVRPTHGQVLYLGKDLAHFSRSSLRKIRSDMQIIFQDPYASLDPRMTIADSIAEGLLAQKKVTSQAAAYAEVDYALERVKLPSAVKWRYPHEFSGGQKQRVCIARALVLKPKLLILDEPTSALDVSIQMQILQLLEELQNELQLSYLLITHNLSVVAYLAHYVAILHHGRIVEQGPTTHILQNPQQHYTQKLLSAIPSIQKSEVILEG
jgi:peptide/nickel transport system ATP-binding protein